MSRSAAIFWSLVNAICLLLAVALLVPRWARAALLVAGCAVLALVLSGCGGGSTGNEPAAAEPYADAAALDACLKAALPAFHGAGGAGWLGGAFAPLVAAQAWCLAHDLQPPAPGASAAAQPGPQP